MRVANTMIYQPLTSLLSGNCPTNKNVPLLLEAVWRLVAAGRIPLPRTWPVAIADGNRRCSAMHKRWGSGMVLPG